MIYFQQINDFLLYGAEDGDYVLSFEEYIKSQISNGVLVRSKDRPLIPYGNTYKYLIGQVRFSSDVILCLRYFYEDVLQFTLNRIREGKNNITLELRVEDPISALPILDIDIKSIELDLDKYLKSNGNYNSLMSGVFSLFTLEELTSLKANNLLSVSSVLHNMLSGSETARVRWTNYAQSL